MMEVVGGGGGGYCCWFSNKTKRVFREAQQNKSMDVPSVILFFFCFLLLLFLFFSFVFLDRTTGLYCIQNSGLTACSYMYA